ncbi:hypothetical protein BDR26DRAFT_868655 [Obelidium mucronatum]|nr:hypothetical protein BDR26DRAFT_868655 [Obelidium mucronatum]
MKPPKTRAPPRTACNRCFKFKKRCVPTPYGCDRCARSGSPCSLESASGGLAATHPAMNSPSALLDRFMKVSGTSMIDLEEEEGWNQDSEPSLDRPQTVPFTATVDQTSENTVLQCILNASEAPLIEPEGAEWQIEDPDLMPTIDDWLVVYLFLTNNGTPIPNETPVPMPGFDSDQFLKDFFQLPAFLRLVALATCTAHTSFEKSLVYYKRARKAAIRAVSETPTYQTVQALVILYIYLGYIGQPALVEPLLKIAMHLIQALRLDVDPDDSPWLFHLNLTPRQKEDRRCAFWGAYSEIVWEAATSPKLVDVPINSNKMKGRSTVYVGSQLIFQGDHFMQSFSILHTVIIAIKKAFVVAPKTSNELIASETVAELQSKMMQVQSQLPTDIREPPELSDNVTGTVELNVNCVGLATICLLNRPRLFLSGFKSFNPMYLSATLQSNLVSSINQSLDAAHRMLNLLRFYTVYTNPQSLEAMPMFEAMIVLWYASCRMDPIWWSVLDRKRMEWCLLREQMQAVVDYFALAKKLDSVGGGVIYPLVQCMRAMVQEIDEYEQWVPATTDGIEEITLGMKVVALDEAESVLEIREPRAYMGLLGMQVGGIRWPGQSEESWRLFWKLLS